MGLEEVSESVKDDAAIRNRLAGCCEGHSFAEIARATGVNAETVRRFATGQGSPSIVFVRRFCEAYRISANWLLLGVGTRDLHVSGPPDLAQVELEELAQAVADRVAGIRGDADDTDLCD